ncbi:transcription termination factor 1-like [Corticium candelabrum]|uniref:transcription termination factor 1-like n=1 Tax=Corticium candelabrum TaxID=121492 RepID=UPI002E264148|nr:transcription termination factor 1-like [Corticium candelabrum]
MERKSRSTCTGSNKKLKAEGVHHASLSSLGEPRKRKKPFLYEGETKQKRRKLEEQLDGNDSSQKKRKRRKRLREELEKGTVTDISRDVLPEKLTLSDQVGLSHNENGKKISSCSDNETRVFKNPLDQVVVKKTKKKKQKKQQQKRHASEGYTSVDVTPNEDGDTPLDCSTNDMNEFQSTTGAMERTEKKKKKKKKKRQNRLAETEDVSCASIYSTDQETSRMKKKKRKKKHKLSMLPIDSSSNDKMCDQEFNSANIDDDGRHPARKQKKRKITKCFTTAIMSDTLVCDNLSAWDGFGNNVAQTGKVASKPYPKSQKETKKKKKGKTQSVQKQTFKKRIVSTDYVSSTACSSSDDEETRKDSCRSGDHHDNSFLTLTHNRRGKTVGRELDDVLDLLDDDDDSPDEYESLHNWHATLDSNSRKEAYESGAKKGVFSKQEIDQISANVKRFCTRHSIKDPAEIAVGGWSNSTYGRAKRSAFFRFSCRHVPRTVYSVYRYLRRILDDTNYKGKFTREESEQLDSLLLCHGSQWEMIGKLMDRSGQSLIDHKRSVSDTKGPWTEQEEKSLLEAIKWVAEQKGLQLDQLPDTDIPWTVVAQRVSERTVVQCRSKWLLNLKCKFRDGRVEKWSKFDDVKLINKINECGAMCFADVPWNDFVAGWPEAGSFHKVRQRFSRLKQMVPDANAKTFEEIMSYLYETVRPMLLPPQYQI